jgi:hypothetical protein
MTQTRTAHTCVVNGTTPTNTDTDPFGMNDNKQNTPTESIVTTSTPHTADVAVQGSGVTMTSADTSLAIELFESALVAAGVDAADVGAAYEGPPLFVNSDVFVNTARLHTHALLECSWYDSHQLLVVRAA